MEKIIELLNEYNNNHHNKSDLYYLFEIENGMLFCYDDVTDVQRTMQDEAMVICSKKFGFIRRLVQNDKIDFDKVMKLGIPCFVQYDNGEIISVHDVDFDRQLIMLLSISDTPIEDLISYLK